jgi:hypothetical protein
VALQGIGDENGVLTTFAILVGIVSKADAVVTEADRDGTNPAEPATANIFLKNDGGVTISRRALGSVVRG